MCVLAITIDDSIVNWVAGICAIAIPAAGTTIVMLWRKLVAFIQPLIVGFFKSHQDSFAAQTELANEMKNQLPIVTETLKKLGETQEQQCKTLEQHGQLLVDHKDQFQEFRDEFRKSNPSNRAES